MSRGHLFPSYPVFKPRHYVLNLTAINLDPLVPSCCSSRKSVKMPNFIDPLKLNPYHASKYKTSSSRCSTDIILSSTDLTSFSISMIETKYYFSIELFTTSIRIQTPKNKPPTTASNPSQKSRLSCRLLLAALNCLKIVSITDR